MLRVIKPLYDIAECGIHWYLTYLEHHVGGLRMRRERADPCVLHDRDDEGLTGFVLMQVDESFGAGTNAFLDNEDKTGEHSHPKPRNILADTLTTFNGTRVQRRDDGSIYTNQKEKCDSLAIPTTQ